jgi:CRISPR-associated endoribonuclease Cas6
LRFSVTYDVVGIPELPIDYRARFMALIKTALEGGMQIENNQQNSFNVHTHLPLCFAIRFGQKPVIDNKRLLIGKKIKIYVTTSSLVLGTTIYNGLLAIKEFKIYNLELTSPFVSYIKEYIIRHNAVTFVTLSPIIIRNCDRRNRYILPNDDGFVQSFHNALVEQWALHNNTNINLYGAINFELLKFRKVVMTHYNGIVLGFTGILQMSAHPDILKFFYQCGIGYRRSNGFGFLEVNS